MYRTPGSDPGHSHVVLALTSAPDLQGEYRAIAGALSASVTFPPDLGETTRQFGDDMSTLAAHWARETGSTTVVERCFLTWSYGPRQRREEVLFGPTADEWDRQISDLLQEIFGPGSEPPRASYGCEFELVTATGQALVTQASLDGRIATEARGEPGLGIDRIMLFSSSVLTLAEAPPATRWLVGPRGQALTSALRCLGQ